MLEVDKGRCGQCRFYEVHNVIKKSSKITWGNCYNPAVSISYTVSTNSPKQALETAKAYTKLEDLIRKDETCFQE